MVPEHHKLPITQAPTAFADFRVAREIDSRKGPDPDSLAHPDFFHLVHDAKVEAVTPVRRGNVFSKVADALSDTIPGQESRGDHWVVRRLVSAEAGEVFILAMRTKYMVGMRISKEKRLEQY